MSKNVWPSWLKSSLPSWLEDIGYPSSGIGDLTDLKFTTQVSDGGRWIGFVNTGWFYHDNKEQYNYVLKKTSTSSSVIGSGSVSASISFRPAWGPILVDSINGPYVEHHNGFYPGISLSWSLVGSGIYSANLPASSLLTGMRDLTILPMGEVAGLNHLISEKFYYYDLDNNKVYIKPKNPSNITSYADIIYFYPQLKFREVVVLEEDGLLASYKNISSVTASRGTDTHTYSGTISGGYLPNYLNCSIGDWVILEYYINRSFILREHNLIHFYTTPTSSEVVTIYYESSIPDLTRSLTLSGIQSGSLNLNPIFSDAFRAGFLYHSTISSGSPLSYWIPKTINLDLDKTEICSTWNEKVKVRLSVLDKNGLPIPAAPFNYTYTLGSSSTSVSGFLDNKGEHHTYITAVTGVNSLSISASIGTISKIASCIILTSPSFITSTRINNGASFIVMTDIMNSRLYTLGYISQVKLDGTPKGGTISIESEMSSMFDTGNTQYTKTAEIGITQSAVNPGAIGEFGYNYTSGDRLVAKNNNLQSNILEIE